MKPQNNLQESVFKELKNKKIPVTIFLVNGYQLKGKIIGFDNFAIIVNSEGEEQLIYKHAISTIIPQENISGSFKSK